MIILVCLLVVALILLIVGIYECNMTYYGTGALKFSVLLFAIAAVVFLKAYDPVGIDYEGQIENVGSEGVTVVYPNEYGETTKTQIIVEAPEKYDIGDTVTIRLEQDFWTWIFNITILDDETE